MSKPRILPATVNPIDIDPGVTYHYVVAITGATSIRVNPSPDFTLSFSGTTLLLKFISGAPVSPTIFAIMIVASNSDGTVTQTLNFRVSPNELSVTAVSFAAVSDGTVDLRFAGIFLRVNDVIYDFNNAYFVVAVGTNTFRYSDTAGGDPITPTITGTIYFNVAITSLASNDIWVGNTSNLSANKPIRLVLDPVGGALENSLSGKIYVKSITDPYHINASLTSGGSVFSPTVNAKAGDGSPPPAPSGRIIVLDQSGNSTGAPDIRTVPDINSAEAAAIARGGLFSYGITCDGSVDSFSADGLPSGLALSGSVITGTAPFVDASYAIILSARKGALSYRRYLLLTIGSGGVLGRTGDSIFTWRT